MADKTTEIQTYTVKRGDTFSGIAFHYGLTTRNLMSWNGLASTLIYQDNVFIVGGVDNFAAIAKDTVVIVEVDNDKVASTGNKLKTNLEKPLIPSRVTERARAKLSNIAHIALGTAYLPAGTTLDGLDTVGFIYWTYKVAGHDLDYLSVADYDMRSFEINESQVQPGDLVFFTGTYQAGMSHMGIYVGNDQFIHATPSTGVTMTRLGYANWSKRFDCFKRFY